MSRRNNFNDAFEERVIGRAQTDSSYRQALLKNPKQAIEQELGLSIPSSMKIKVVEESPNEVCLVLPAQVTGPGGELSEAALAGVAGGGSSSWGPSCDHC